MKSDSYLNLCLEQAMLSPLRHRHGCVVVKGGKVIGQGFNDYRPGYDGGALKTGQLPAGAFPLNPYVKGKPNDRAKLKPDQGDAVSTFKAFESLGLGRGHHANQPLSMHSEMMAINSALSAASTLAASTVSHIQPYFKLSHHSKRRILRRSDAVKAYEVSACVEIQGQNVQCSRSDVGSQQQQ